LVGAASRAAAVAAVSLVVASVGSSVAAARPAGGIRTGPNGVTVLGPWHVSADSTFPAAVRALGAATAVHVHLSGNSCTGTGAWSRLGLRVLFTSFSADPYCKHVRAQNGTISGAAGRRHWQTVRGLRVGDSLAQLERLYPGAIKVRGGRAIAYNLHNPIVGGRLDVVTAQLTGNRVTSFKLWFGGAGD
jgi:hypothetical protein